MKIFTINEQLIDEGRETFMSAMRQYLCGPAAPHYGNDMSRASGLSTVPGAIVAALELGLEHENEILPAVARASRCRESTVLTILEYLANPDLPCRLVKGDQRGSFNLLESPWSGSVTLIAA